MKLSKFKSLKKEILKLKPKNVKLKYGKESKYIPKSKTIYIKKLSTRIEILYMLLHEICHTLTIPVEKLNHDIELSYNIKTKRFTIKRPTPKFYLREYQAEKMLREICRENQWKDILEISDLVIKDILKQRRFDKEGWPTENYAKIIFFGYEYMAHRICREEKNYFSIRKLKQLRRELTDLK